MVGFFVWELVDARLLLDRQWGADTLVWNRASGDTHLLNELASQVYRCLSESAATPEELQAALALPTVAPSGNPSALEATLQEMARLGLVVARPL